MIEDSERWMGEEELRRKLDDLLQFFKREATRKHPEGWLVWLVTREGFRMEFHTKAPDPPFDIFIPRVQPCTFPLGPEPDAIVDLDVAPRYHFRPRWRDDKRSIAWYGEV